MKKDYLLHFILSFIICIYQISLISGLPSPFLHINLIGVFIIFTLILKGVNIAFIWIFLIGTIFDILSFYPFGLHLIVFSTALLLTNFFYANYFTDKSLYSIIFLFSIFLLSSDSITILAIHFLQILGFIKDLNTTIEQQFLLEANRIIINWFVIIILFYVISLISRDLKPIFLRRNSQKLQK